MPNVMEVYPIYDTIVVSPILYGNELTTPGWFTSMTLFGQQREHRFFKSRNRASCGLAYNNMQSQDRADFAFHAISIGLSFFGPCTPFEYGGGYSIFYNPALSTFWNFDLPNHVSLSFRLAADTRLEANGYHVPSGYGPVVGGMTQGLDAFPGTVLGQTQAVWTGTQGIAVKENRYVFDTEIEIPRNETFEAKLELSEYAQGILSQIMGPGSYTFLIEGTEAPTSTSFQCRYGIQCSLYGMREVQQRGSLHA